MPKRKKEIKEEVKVEKKVVKKELTKADKILDLIKEICTVSDRRFNIQVIYRYCLENSVLKNYHDLEEIFLVLEKEGKIYNIGGTSWILPKPKRVR